MRQGRECDEPQDADILSVLTTTPRCLRILKKLNMEELSSKVIFILHSHLDACKVRLKIMTRYDVEYKFYWSTVGSCVGTAHTARAR